VGRGHPDGGRVPGQAGGGGHPEQPHLPDRERQRGGDGHLHRTLQTEGDRLVPTKMKMNDEEPVSSSPLCLCGFFFFFSFFFPRRQ